MADLKKIVVNLPESMLKEFDENLKKDNKNRSEFIREAIILYIRETEKNRFKERLRRGYEEMSKLNQEIAEFGFAVDISELNEYEARLSECDIIDDDDSKKRRYILC